MNLEPAQKLLHTGKVLKYLGFYEFLDSTNTHLMKNRHADGTVILAREQTAGRGKQGAKWVSGAGGLWFSFVVHKKTTEPYINVIISSVAVVRALKKLGIKAVIKWPNDIMVRGKKICGILIENDHYNGRVITGIGINVNNELPEGTAYRPISVKTVLKKEVDLEIFFADVLKELDRLLAAKSDAKVIAEWVKNQQGLKGREIKVRRNGEEVRYKAKKVNKDGSITAVDADKKVVKLKGEVFFL